MKINYIIYGSTNLYDIQCVNLYLMMNLRCGMVMDWFSMNWLEKILNTPDDSDIGYFTEDDLRYPDNIKEKTKNFPFCPENKIIHKHKYNDNENLKQIKPKNYAKSKKLICDWTDKKKYLVHYRMLKLDVRHGKWLEKI